MPGVAIWDIFQFLEGRAISNSHGMYLNNNIEAHRDRETNIKKVSSAWTEVWADNWCLKPTRPNFLLRIFCCWEKSTILLGKNND